MHVLRDDPPCYNHSEMELFQETRVTLSNTADALIQLKLWLNRKYALR